MKVFVTGATGFIGSHTAALLLREGHELCLLVRDPRKAYAVLGRHGFEPSQYKIYQGDITDRSLVAKALQDCDAVFHSAALVNTAKKHADAVFRTNTEGTKNVLGTACQQGIGHIVYVSSVTAIFDEKAERIDELSPPGSALSAYGHSKVWCEQYARDLQQEHPLIITYPSGVIGPLDPGLTEPMHGLVMFLSNMGACTSTGIQLVDVRDCASIHVDLLCHYQGPDRFVLGGHYVPWDDLVETLEDLSGRKLHALHLNPAVLRGLGSTLDWLSDVTGWDALLTREGMNYATQWAIADNRHLQQRLGFQFRDLSETLRDAILWLGYCGHLSDKQLGDLASQQGYWLNETATASSQHTP